MHYNILAPLKVPMMPCVESAAVGPKPGRATADDRKRSLKRAPEGSVETDPHS